MSRFNAQNIAKSPYNGPIVQPSIIKNIELSYIVGAPIVISKIGTIYASCLNDTLYALDNDLNILWKRNVDTQIGGWGISYPAIGPSGNVYIFDYNGNRLLSLDPDNGNLIWQSENLGDYSRGIPVIDANETIYIFAGGVCAVSQSGTKIWNRFLANLTHQVALSPDENRVYVSTSPQLAAIDSQTGNDIWYKNFSSHTMCPKRPAVSSNGTIYAAGQDSLFAIAPDNTILWRAYAGSSGRPGWTAIDELLNQVYVASANDTMYAFTFYGTNLWKTKSEHFYHSDGAPIIGNNGIIYLLCKDDNTEHKLQAFSPSSGAILWSITGSIEEGGTGSIPTSQPVISADENIYIGNARGIYVVGDGAAEFEELPSDKIPFQISLQQNYPNPFNPVTTISFDLPEYSKVNLSIYNLLGQKVATLIDEKMKAGNHEITWNAENFA
ncbi:PQQ-binding-like beta-propeller repeat protein, partial [Calditrichota bacterium]